MVELTNPSAGLIRIRRFRRDALLVVDCCCRCCIFVMSLQDTGRGGSLLLHRRCYAVGVSVEHPPEETMRERGVRTYVTRGRLGPAGATQISHLCVRAYLLYGTVPYRYRTIPVSWKLLNYSLIATYSINFRPQCPFKLNFFSSTTSELGLVLEWTFTEGLPL